jgi:hypothetical protein
MSLFTKAAVAFSLGLLAVESAVSSSAGEQAPIPPGLPILFQTDRTGTSDIYAMDELGRRQVPVVTGESNDEDPDWAPDGASFAFSSDRDETWQIYVADTAGGQPRQLTQGLFSNVDPVFSPDGSRFAFETNRTGNWEIYVMSVDGSEQVNLSRSSAQDLDPSWSPDGRRVVFDRIVPPGADLYSVDVRTRRARRLTVTKQPEVEPAYSPEDTRIAFVRFEKQNYDLYILDRTGTRATRLTSGPAADQDPSWSPDTRTIVYASSLPGADLEIFSIASAGGKPRNLTRNHVGNDSEADWGQPTRAVRRPAVIQVTASSATHGPLFVCGMITSIQIWPPWKVLNGGPFADRLCGTASKEWLRGYGGIDKLAGGQHEDRLEGGHQADLFKSHEGQKDVLYGGQLSLNSATHAITGHSDVSLTDTAYVDKFLDVYAPVATYGINKVNP